MLYHTHGGGLQVVTVMYVILPYRMYIMYVFIFLLGVLVIHGNKDLYERYYVLLRIPFLEYNY